MIFFSVVIFFLFEFFRDFNYIFMRIILLVWWDKKIFILFNSFLIFFLLCFFFNLFFGYLFFCWLLIVFCNLLRILMFVLFDCLLIFGRIFCFFLEWFSCWCGVFCLRDNGEVEVGELVRRDRVDVEWDFLWEVCIFWMVDMK